MEVSKRENRAKEKEVMEAQANYKAESIDSFIFISKVTKVGKVGKYNIFQMEQGNQYIVVFDNQLRLLELMSENAGKMFLLKFLKKESPYSRYHLKLDSGEIQTATLAWAYCIPGNMSKVEQKNGFNVIL